MKILSFLGIFLLILSGCVRNSSPMSTEKPAASTPAPVAPIPGEVLGPTTILAITPFFARGTEPFWIFEQSATGAIYSTPNGTGGITTLAYTTTQTMVGPQIIVSAIPVATGSALTITLTPGSCSDGMSELAYTYAAQVVIGAQIDNGCAN